MTTLLQWNANSIIAHGPELKNYIVQQHHAPDIICVQETYLHRNLDFKINGYSIERLDREPGDRGGLAVCVRNGISFSRLRTPAVTGPVPSLTVTGPAPPLAATD